MYVVIVREAMNFSLSISPSKEMGDLTTQGKNSWPWWELNPQPPDFIIIALMISYEAKWEQVVGNYGGNQDVTWVQRFFSLPCLVYHFRTTAKYPVGNSWVPLALHTPLISIFFLQATLSIAFLTRQATVSYIK